MHMRIIIDKETVPSVRENLQLLVMSNPKLN
jgi:hypothetical protein